MQKIIIEIISGVFLIILGVLINLDASPSIYGFSVPKSLGLLFAISGLLWVLYVLFNQKKLKRYWKEIEEQEKIVICPECLKTEYAKDNPELKCTKCQVNLEQLNGFYERHPEKKVKIYRDRE